MLTWLTDRQLHRVLCCNVLQDHVPCRACRLPMQLPPKKFLQVAWDLVGMAAFHPLQFTLHSIPVTLHIVGMNPSYWVYEVHGVVNGVVCSHITQGLYSAICCPLVGMNSTSWCCMHLDDGQECCRITGMHHLHVPQSRLL